VRKLVPGLIVLVSLMGGTPPLRDEQIAGTWQGLLKEGSRELRLVFKVAFEHGRLTAVNYSLDESGAPIPVSAISRNGSTIKMSIAAVSGRFEGKLSADGNTISGTFTRLNTAPLTLVRATNGSAWAIPEPEAPRKMMAADVMPQFEVATIKPSGPDGQFAIRLYTGGLVVATSATAGDLIRFAYDVHPRQIIGGRGWIDSERYDVTGKPDTVGTPSLPQAKAMMRKLLADRFALDFHREQREMSVYAITIAKGAPKLGASNSGGDVLPSFRTTANGIFALNATIQEFAQILQANFLDQPVVDMTGLGLARYAFTLKWTPDPSQAGASRANNQTDDADSPPDLFTAFQQQLGLKLQLTKGRAEVLVIGGIEQPSAN
jgi:uncharacterized protein (TIGR03435 family)